MQGVQFCVRLYSFISIVAFNCKHPFLLLRVNFLLDFVPLLSDLSFSKGMWDVEVEELRPQIFLEGFLSL